MKNTIKTPKCGRCRFFSSDINYLYHGVCAKDKEVVRAINVCNKLPSDNERRDAKSI